MKSQKMSFWDYFEAECNRLGLTKKERISIENEACSPSQRNKIKKACEKDSSYVVSRNIVLALGFGLLLTDQLRLKLLAEKGKYLSDFLKNAGYAFSPYSGRDDFLKELIKERIGVQRINVELQENSYELIGAHQWQKSESKKDSK